MGRRTLSTVLRSLALPDSAVQLYLPVAADRGEPAWLELVYAPRDRISNTVYRLVEADGEDAIPWLLDVVRDRSLLTSDAPGGGHAPVRAARLLGHIGAIDLFLEAVRLYQDLDRADERRPAVAGALRRLGTPATLGLVKACQGLPLGAGRSELAGLLARIGRRDRGVLETLLAELEYDVRWGTGVLVHHGDPRCVEHIDRRLATLVVDPRHIQEVEADSKRLAQAVWDFDQHLSDAALKRVDEIAEARDRHARAQWRTQPQTHRPGRNEPCHCGSGKKYKKCHLRADEACLESHV